MKKFISFFCALAIVLSANAAPFRPPQLKSQFEKTRNEQPVAVKKAAQKKPRLAKPLENTSSSKTLRSLKTARRVAGQPKVTKATTDVTITGVATGYYSSTYFAYQLTSEDGLIIFSFGGFPLEDGANDVEPGRTYTLSELEPYYCYWFYSDDSDYADFTECTFTKTLDENGNVLIAATATDENGDKWNLTYDATSLPELPNGGTYATDAVSGTYYASSSDIQYILTFAEDNLEFYFDILLPEGEKDVVSGKTYTLEDFDLDYSAGIFAKVTVIKFASVSFVKTADEDGAYTIEAVVVDTEGNTWNLSAAKSAPSLSEQTLTLDGFVEAGSSFSQIEAANEDSTIIVSLLIYDSNPVGTFTEADMFSYYSFVLYTATETYYDVEEAEVTVAFNETTGNYELEGTLLTVNEEDDADLILFTLHLTLAGDAPVEVVPSDMTFSFEITETGILITPSNDTDPWDYDIITPEDLEANYDNDIDAFAADDYDYYGDYYAYPGAWELTFEDLLEDLEEGVYVLIVWGADGGVTTPAASFTFTLTSGSEAVENIDVKTTATKRLVNGTLVIEKNGTRYNALGTIVK